MSVAHSQSISFIDVGQKHALLLNYSVVRWWNPSTPDKKMFDKARELIFWSRFSQYFLFPQLFTSDKCECLFLSSGVHCQEFSLLVSCCVSLQTGFLSGEHSMKRQWEECQSTFCHYKSSFIPDQQEKNDERFQSNGIETKFDSLLRGWKNYSLSWKFDICHWNHLDSFKHCRFLSKIAS